MNSMEHIPGYDEWKTSAPEEEKPVMRCDICGKAIYSGDYVTDIQGEKWCDDCLEDIRQMI